MRDALRQVKPTRFDDLIALVALYRPGPMENIPQYARRKNGREQIDLPAPEARADPRRDDGRHIYQEQAMQIAKDLAGFTPGRGRRSAQGDRQEDQRADGLARAEVPRGLRATNGVTTEVAEELWADNERSADYSFNKAHAACYALIAYRTAYLKANYPAPYMAALISSVMSTKDKVPFYVAECAEMGIEVLPPDVNASGSDFAVVDGKIRFGLAAVKGVGESAVRAIVAARDEERPVQLGLGLLRARRRAAAQQARAREPDQVRRRSTPPGATRRAMLAVLDPAMAVGQKAQADAMLGQGSIFDLGEPVGRRAVHAPPSADRRREFDRRELLAFEKETLGLYITSHPLAEVRDQLRRKVDLPLARAGLPQRGRGRDGRRRSSRAPHLVTKRGEPMAFVRLDDSVSTGRGRGLQLDLRQCARAPARGRVLVVKGRVDRQEEGETKVVAFEVTPFDAAPLVGEVRVARRRPHGAGVVHRRARPGDPRVPRRVAGRRRDATPPTGRAASASARPTRCGPRPDFFAEVRVLGGEAQYV